MARRLGKKRASAYLAFHRAEYNFVWFSSLPDGGTAEVFPSRRMLTNAKGCRFLAARLEGNQCAHFSPETSASIRSGLPG